MSDDHITGYQWGDGNRYIGPYDFPANIDQYAIHLPPRTTMTAPPKEIPPGQVAVWDEARERWNVAFPAPTPAPAAAPAPSRAPDPALNPVATPAVPVEASHDD